MKKRNSHDWKASYRVANAKVAEFAELIIAERKRAENLKASLEVARSLNDIQREQLRRAEDKLLAIGQTVQLLGGIATTIKGQL